MMACGMGTTIDCGSDSCDAKYYAPPDVDGGPVMQACNGSCNCTHANGT